MGYISHYFSGIGVGIIELTQGILKVGDKIRIKGQTTEFTQKIDSMQYDHAQVKDAKTGQSVGIKVSDRVREHDKVYKM
ncbi:MAG: EF-Tu/IF-2/RF-3 family GTPase [Nanoarchaeota archaeon]